jgi:hypothetical protein
MAQIGEVRRIIEVEPIFSPIPSRENPSVQEPSEVPTRIAEPDPELVPARSE